MNKKIIFILFLIFGLVQINLAQSVYSGKIVNKKDNSSIPYANIWILDSSIGTTSDPNGYFSIKSDSIKKEDKLAISSIGFSDTIIPLHSFSSVISLEPKYYMLPEVSIVPTKQNKQQERIINKLKKNRMFAFLFSEGEPIIYGVYFLYKQEYSNTEYIKSISMRISTISSSKFNLRIYSFDTIACQPINELVHENIIVSTEKSKPIKFKTLEIDLRKYNIRFPKEGILFAVEWLIIPENKFYAKYYRNKYGKYVENLFYGPTIGGYINNNKFGYKYDGGIWRGPQYFYKKKSHGYKLAMSLKLSK